MRTKSRNQLTLTRKRVGNANATSVESVNITIGGAKMLRTLLHTISPILHIINV